MLSRLKGHDGAVNVIATLSGKQLFVSGGADSVIKIWKLSTGGQDTSLTYTFTLKPRYIPLSIAVGHIGFDNEADSVFLTIGGTRNSIQTYAVSHLAAGNPIHSLQATLTGHESWITSLALKRTGQHANGAGNDLWLASASQDKSVRLWRILQNDAESDALLKDDLIMEETLRAKTHKVQAGSISLSITFEALLLGHEDWIYTASWDPQPHSLRLLTASADNSLIMWEPEPSSGIWVNSSRLGEISGQKGAISATGSTGGFWTGLWSPDAGAVTCLGKSGSWRLWCYDKERSFWIQKSSLTGHTKVVTDLSWASGGDYLLSTSSDQTTRLHAEWRSKGSGSWHEFARPQIHGYDLNCVQSLSAMRFVSGADEKLLRVFDQPRNVAGMLERLCGINYAEDADSMPEAANLPALGLSNKAITLETDDVERTQKADAAVATNYDSDEPPTEDFLSRHTLWPECEKLYGHGHEISALAANRSGTIIATACKSSSTEHAVIRLYDTKDWLEIRPPLTAHSLTIVRLRFHPNNDQLLSVGRDRQWALFKPAELSSTTDPESKASLNYSLVAANPKGHSRMILDVAWSAIGCTPLFATAGREKNVKIWAPSSDQEDDYICRMTITRKAPVTAIDFYGDAQKGLNCLAVGEETGRLSFHIIPPLSSGDAHLEVMEPLTSVDIEESLCPSKAVTRLAWRPHNMGQGENETPAQLAIASADISLRLLSIYWQDWKA